jgi:hypothetical protein
MLVALNCGGVVWTAAWVTPLFFSSTQRWECECCYLAICLVIKPTNIYVLTGVIVSCYSQTFRVRFSDVTHLVCVTAAAIFWHRMVLMQASAKRNVNGKGMCSQTQSSQVESDCRVGAGVHTDQVESNQISANPRGFLCAPEGLYSDWKF